MNFKRYALVISICIPSVIFLFEKALADVTPPPPEIEYALCPPEEREKLKDTYLHIVSYERMSHTPPKEIISLMNIKPGMTILDFGAGFGYFTFPLAEALKNTGRVYAADPFKMAIDYLNSKTIEKKLINVSPVIVKTEGMDPFYKQNTFDIIFMSEMYVYVKDWTEFFAELKPSLSKDGRIYILNFKLVGDFHWSDFFFLEDLFQRLRKEGPEFPIFKKLGTDLQSLITNWDDKTIPKGKRLEIQAKFVRDFNKMLADRFLFNELVDWYSNLNANKFDARYTVVLGMIPNQYEAFCNWILTTLDSTGVFEEGFKILTENEKRDLQGLNSLVLLKVLGLRDKFFDKGELTFPYTISKDALIAKMESAGYELVKEYNFLPRHDFLEFKNKYQSDQLQPVLPSLSQRGTVKLP